jgi:aspartyl-tRNA(Asn)/glutamyl-tRNA(Gln) amidotransferase subunit B
MASALALSEYEAVIGLEVHSQLLTQSKCFCACSSQFGAPPNSHVCPVCMGMPGTLPVLNRRVLELAIRLGLAAHCEIAPRSTFARKNYFYPDLPKGYQISQYDEPLCVGGYLDLPGEDGAAPRRIRLVRIHLEEDAGKNVHLPDCSLVDFNRSGLPLVEIVSEPDLRSAREAGAYLRELRAIVRYLKVSDGNMEEGNFRCDANVSVRPRGSAKLGAKVEVKNMNSFRHVENAIEYEIERQIEALRAGERIAQETRLWNPDRATTHPMRSKEFAHDYRYFPEPDLAPVLAPRELVEAVAARMPELPAQRRTRYVEQLGISAYEAQVLTAERELADYFEALLPIVSNTRMAANWVMTEVLRMVNESGRELTQAVPPAAEVGALLKLVERETISLNAAKTAFAAMCKSGQGAAAVVAELGLAQVSDESAIAQACQRVLQSEPDKVAEFRGGRDKLFGFFVGQVMKVMGGKANPKVINEILRRHLGSN